MIKTVFSIGLGAALLVSVWLVLAISVAGVVIFKLLSIGSARAA